MSKPIEKLITEDVLNDILVDFLKKLKEQNSKQSEESNKEVENQFWKLIKPALGEKNWEGNTYKGGALNQEEVSKIVKDTVGEHNFKGRDFVIGKEVILKAVKEIFGKKNFSDDEYSGGWNKDQDTENIKEVVGRDNFRDGKLSIPAGWDKEKDLQNLKDNKPYLSEVVKDNLGDFKKDVDNRFEDSKKELQTKLQEADTKIAQGEQKLNETANTIKKDVEDKANAIKSEVDEKLTKADTDIKTKLGEVDAKLVKSDTDIKEKLKGVDTKLETADKEIKDKLQAVDTKLTETEKKIKDEVIPTVQKRLGKFEDENYLPAPKEKYLTWEEAVAIIHTVFGTEYFYKKGDENIPADKIGFYKNKKELAQIAFEAEQQIRDMEKWNNFFLKHRTDKDNKLKWTEKYSSPELAEGAFEDAVVEAEQKLAGGTLKQGEISTINKAQTPDKLKEIVNDIPRQRRLLAWEDFFTNYDAKGYIQELWKDNWRNSQLNPEVAKSMYDNGWYNSPNAKIGDDKLIESFTTEEKVYEDTYPLETKNINPLIHLSSELQKVHNFIAKRIEAETILDKFPDVVGNNLEGELTEIKLAYSQDKVPDTREYVKIKELRDKRIKDLFSKYFQGETATELSEKDIELWRASPTGLPNTGKDQRKAFDNGWTEPNKIQGAKTEYLEVKNIEVLKYKKSDIEKEIAKVNEWIGKIQGYKKLRELDQKNEEINDVLLHLNLELLPVGSKGKVEKEVSEARERLNYYLGDPEDGGIEENHLNEIEQAIKEKQPQRTYEIPTVERLKTFLAASKHMGIKVKDENRPAGSINDWLKDRKAYEMKDTPEGKVIMEKEDKLDLEVRGQYQIPFCYIKAAEGGGYQFNPDDLNVNTSFCQVRFKEKTSWGRTKASPFIYGTQGHLPFATGIGKTTKVVNCLCRGGAYDEINKKEGRHIVLIMPTQALVEAAYGHHNQETGWLQNWGCVKCQDWMRATKVKRGTYKPITEQEIADGVEWETKDIFRSHGKYKVVKNDLLPRGEKGLSIITGDELIGWFDRDLLFRNKKYVYEQGELVDKVNKIYTGVGKEVDVGGENPLNLLKPDDKDPNWFSTQKEIEDWKAEVRSKLIDKENAYITFDEGHFAIPSYQAAQLQSIYMNYNVIRMSATFEGQPFSITSTYYRDNLYVGKELNSKMSVGEWNGKQNTTLNEFLATAKIWFFVPSLDFNAEQKRALGNISWISYTPEWDPYVEPVSRGMPRPSWSFVDPRLAVGMNPDADGVFLGGKMEVKTLIDKFRYKWDNEANLTQADGVQMIGRVARDHKGKAFLFSLKWEPLDISKDVGAGMVESMVDGEIKHMTKLGYELIQDIQMLRLAIALPKKFGKPLEEILIGVNATEKSEKERLAKGLPLTKILWRKENEKPKYAIGSVDDDLWDSYNGKKKMPEMKIDVAKDRLLECIATYISEADGFPKKIKVWRQSSLVEFIWGKDIKEGKKAPIIAEIKKVLNGVIGKGIDGFGDKGYDKISKTAKDRKTIETVADYYKIADANIDVSYQWNTENTKQLLTLIIEKN